MRPPAIEWKNGNDTKKNYYNELIESAIRAHDPFQKVINGWLIRRLSPDSNPIAISDWPKKRDEIVLIKSMAREVANVHLSKHTQVEKIVDHLRTAKASWLHSAAKQMIRVVEQDWKQYRRR